MHRQLSPAQQQPEQQPQSHSRSQSQQQAQALADAPPIPPAFTRRKEAILDQISVPDEDYTDLSPKGTIDAGIRDLIDEINALDGLVTTSSCAGRVSVFLEGRRGGAGAGGVGAVGDEGGELPGHYLAVVDGEDEEDEEAEEEEELDVADAPVESGDDFGETPGSEGDGAVRQPSGPIPGADGGGVGGGGGGGGRGEGGTVAGVGGKGGGGRWLFVSHDPVETRGKLDSEPNIVAALLGMDVPIFDGREGISAEDMSAGESRLIHFKFEPMILHILTASPHHAQLVLRCGLQAGFRESGAINLLPASSSAGAAVMPIVAIRSMGLGLESLIGRETNRIKHCTVSGEYLKALTKIANERFVENARRIARFRALLKEATTGGKKGGRRRKGDSGGDWEDADVRRERKRLEGLKRAEEVRRVKELQRKQDEKAQAPAMPGVVVEQLQ